MGFHAAATRPRAELPLAGAILIAAALGARPAKALAPDELLLVCNTALPASCELAEYYARQRSVPAVRICRLHVDPRFEEISEAGFRTHLREPIRAFLKDHRLAERVRCLVTFYGLPIRVGAIQSTPDDKKLLAELERQFLIALDELEQAIARMDGLGRVEGRQPPPRKPTMKDYTSIVRDYARVRRETQERVGPRSSMPEGAGEFQAFMQIIEQIEGSASLIQQMQVVGGRPDDENHRRLDAARREVQAADRRIVEEASRSVADPARPQLRDVVRTYRGWLGLLQLLDNDMQRLRTDETAAAVDSELTLLWHEDYPRWRWMLNPLSWNNRSSLGQQPPPASVRTTPVLMVSRLDASKPAVVRRMIDGAMTAERNGLAGRIYLDARGINNQDPTGQYDQSLRDLGLLIQRHTSLPVTLDNRSEVFAPGACPGTMLYCGWYNLRRYVNAFTFVPGAVAFHVASFEAISLKTPGEQGWCKNLLDAGAVATMGPVAEPYLHSFPRPGEFFGLLLTGRFTLVECYTYTTPLNSWMMMLLGDPLYRPFAAKPALRLEQVFEPEKIPPEFRTEVTSHPAGHERAARGDRSAAASAPGD